MSDFLRICTDCQDHPHGGVVPTNDIFISKPNLKLYPESPCLGSPLCDSQKVFYQKLATRNPASIDLFHKSINRKFEEKNQAAHVGREELNPFRPE